MTRNSICIWRIFLLSTWVILLLPGAEEKFPLYKKPNQETSSRSREPAFQHAMFGESTAKRRLLDAYDTTSRPVHQYNDTVTVSIGISLFHILDTNEKSQTISTLLAVRMQWWDHILRWNASDWDGVTKIWIPANRIWTPDLVINNNADDNFRKGSQTNAIIQSDGNVLWMYPAVVKTYCTLNVRYFPFDSQACEIVFISWTYNGLEVDLVQQRNHTVGNYYNEENQEWSVHDISVLRREKFYICCPEPFPDLTFTVHIKRRSTFYVFNLVFPCFLLYVVSFVGFFLPIESSDKITLEITILLAMVVFLMVIADTLPPTPESIPLLGLFFGAVMVMVSLALTMAVIVTRIRYSTAPVSEIPAILRYLFLSPRRYKLVDFFKLFVLRKESQVETPLVANSVSMDQLQGCSVTADRISKNSANEIIRMSVLSQDIGLLSAAGNSVREELPIDTFTSDNTSNFLSERQKDQTLHVSQTHEDWIFLAKELDKFFCMIFFILSISFLLWIFNEIPS